MHLFQKNPANNLFLAPLQQVTTAPFRNFCRHFYDVGLVTVPMLYPERITSNPKSIMHELYKIEEESPLGVQLIVNDVEILKKSIDFLESYSFEVLDINAGCPSKRAIHSRRGGYLTKDLELLKSIVKTTVKYSSRPVSLKTRIGFENSNKINEIGKIANESGIEFLTVHARTVKNKFNDKKLDINVVKQLKEMLDIPLVGNGDIFDPPSAKKFLEETKVDALMIGRGTIGNPDIFTRIHDFLLNDILLEPNTSKEKMKELIELYERKIDEFLVGIKLNYPEEEFKFTELKRNSIWLTKNLENSTSIRSKLSKTKSLKQLKTTLNDYFK